MKTIINKITLLAATFGLFIAGCSDKDLAVQPRQSVASDNALNTVNNVDAAVIGVYATLKNRVLYGRDFVAYGDVMADNAIATNKSGRLVGEAATTAVPTMPTGLQLIVPSTTVTWYWMPYQKSQLQLQRKETDGKVKCALSVLYFIMT